MSSNTTPEKTLLWMFHETDIVILVPKQRGAGYLKTPMGHHLDSALQDAIWSIPTLDQCDIFGLDGYLEIKGDFSQDGESSKRTSTALMKALSEHYGFPNKLVDPSQFWDTHNQNLGTNK